MLNLDRLRALVSVVDATRAYQEATRDDAPAWLRDIRQDVLYEAIASATERGHTDDQVNAVICDVTEEVYGLSSHSTTPV